MDPEKILLEFKPPCPVSTPISEHLSDPTYVPNILCFAAQGSADVLWAPSCSEW